MARPGMKKIRKSGNDEKSLRGSRRLARFEPMMSPRTGDPNAQILYRIRAGLVQEAREEYDRQVNECGKYSFEALQAFYNLTVASENLAKARRRFEATCR